MGTSLTHKQGGMLFRLTLRKFWEHPTPPTIREASDLITACLDAVRAHGPEPVRALLVDRAVERVRRWYPDFNPSDLQPRFGHGHGRKREEPDPEPAPDPPQSEPRPQRGNPTPAPDPTSDPEPAEPQEADPDLPPEPESDPEPDPPQDPEPDPEAEPDPEPEAEPDPEPAKPTQPRNGHATRLQTQIEALVGAGIQQLLAVGPAGCGKTTCAGLAASALGRDCTLIPCSLGTPSYTFTGRRHPISGAFESTEFTEAYKAGRIIILDEVDKLDPSTAAAVNAALANGHIATPAGPIARHPQTVVIATANTWGNGADRQYCGSNQLDAATLDRFAGGRLEADYDPDYESQYDPEVVSLCRRVREHIKARHLRRVCSTRMIIACDKLKAAGLDWQGQVTADWADSEREGLR